MGTGKSPRSTVGKLETQESWWHGSRPNVGRLETQEVPVLQTQGNQTGGVSSYQPFSSVQAPSWLEEAHPYREGSLLYHVCWFKCEFAPEAPSHTLRIVLIQYQHPMAQSNWCTEWILTSITARSLHLTFLCTVESQSKDLNHGEPWVNLCLRESLQWCRVD